MSDDLRNRVARSVSDLVKRLRSVPPCSVQVIVPPYFQVEPEGMVGVPEGETQLYHIYQLVG